MAPPTSTRSSSVVAFIGIGLVAGLLAGLLGVGGGIVLVPLLVGTLAFDQHRAHATSLGAMVVIALAGTIGFAAGGEVSWSIGVVVAAGALVGSTLGARAMGRLSPRVLRLVFVVVLAAAGIRMLAGGGDIAMGAGLAGIVAGLVALAIGIVAGFAGAVAGVGGGIIIVPSLVFLLGVDQHMAEGTSLLAIVFTALAATRVNWRERRLRPLDAAVLGGAGAVSAFLGARIALALEAPVLTQVFGVFALVVAVRMAVSLTSR